MIEEKPAVPVMVPETTPPPPLRPVTGLIPEEIIRVAEKKYGIFARNRYEAFNAKLYELQNSSTAMKLEVINSFFNDVPYDNDLKVWGQQDYWATPLEFLGRDRGDCEDYVIAKYFTLRNLGIGSDKLYFSYVKSLRFNTEHMVLTYFETPHSIPLVLDNANYKIFPADRRKDLVPVFNFNMSSLYCANCSGQNAQQITPSSRTLSRWERLLDDIKHNKL